MITRAIGRILASPRWARHRRLLATIGLLALLWFVAEFAGWRDLLHIEAVRQAFLDHPVGGFVLFVAFFAVGNLVQVPGWIFLAAAVLALGRSWGGLATYFAASISCAVTFIAVRWVGGNALRQIEHPLAVRLLAGLDTWPIRSVAVLRIVFQTAPALNYALAISGVRFRQYLVGTLIGLPLPILMYCLFFDFLAHAVGLA